ncbi:hypothetical protein [Tropicimonas sediminicola]|uniref:Uncharacterized protein n=1 Tax=Tropicimonas sediminicola TaxID=1031541 RepID=A0A239M2B1_9RHOB|nr:hypothetical protein [Tropicimonas sediminicola]SNT36795.1 hypothetical protein SAMN05421757_11240 [Tropicimonas sediminicola]
MANWVQITPNFPPVVCGVGDYSAGLAAALGNLGTGVTTLVANENPISQPGRSLHGARSSRALCDALRDTGARVAIVHFSGYGYAPRGLCHWLVEGLRGWKATQTDARIITIFHEVYATGPIWRTSFWTSHPQRRIARALCEITDRGFVSSGVGSDQLRRIGASLSCDVLAVFSNVGEPAEVTPLSRRSARAVVFGGRGQRAEVYHAIARNPQKTAQLLSNLQIDRLLDIGPRMPLPERIGECPVDALGTLPAEEVSRILVDCRLGLLHYPMDRMTKSGIAAAYFSHGLLTANTGTAGGAASNLKEGVQYSSLDRLVAHCPDLQSVADAGHAWYQQHGVAAAAEIIRNSIA